MREVPAGKFKDICLKLLHEVAAGGGPVVITRWGRPVARLVPALDPGKAEKPPPGAGDGGGAANEAAEPAAPYGGVIPAARAGGAERAPSKSLGENQPMEAARNRLRRLAAGFGVTPAELLREALDAYVGEGSLDSRVAAARKVVGAYRSGRATTARDHDEALAEIALGSRS